MNTANWCRLLLLVALISLYVGSCLGRNYAIKQADLLDINETEYYIAFGDDVHTYIRDVK